MMEKKEMKPQTMKFSGEVTNMDMAMKMMTVNGKRVICPSTSQEQR